jgi:DNA-binding LytR/AlgR family response regulator
MDILVVNLKTGTPKVIQSKQVVYLESREGKTIIHTKTSEYRPAYALRDFAPILFAEGFEALEKSNLTNMTEVRDYDLSSKKAFFDKSRKGKHVSVSRRNKEKLEGL